MIYLYKDPKGDKIFEITTTKFNTQVSSALNNTFRQQQNQQNPTSSSTTPSDDREKEELKEIIRQMEKTIRKKDRIIVEQQSALDAYSSVDSTI